MERINTDYIKQALDAADAFTYSFEIKSYKQELLSLHDVLSDIIEYIFKGNDSKQIILALDECLHNAYEHGNLELSHTEKSDYLDNESFEQQLRNREKEFGERLIKVSLNKKNKALSISIQDEGNGFDWKEQKAHPKPDDLHGRGLRIIQSTFDSVLYNDKGNVCTVVKKLNEDK